MPDTIRSPEQAAQSLQALYAGCGYQPFRVKKFERYELYSENRRFLTTEKVLTFTNTDGRLMAMKPDVTLSIVQDTQPEGLRKVFYREQRPGEGFREIPQAGLECIGALDAVAVGEVVSLAATSLLAISDACVLNVSHIGVISGVLEEAALDETAQKAVFAAVGAKNVPALKTLCDEKTAAVLAALSDLHGPLEEALPLAEALDLPDSSRAALAALRALSGQLAAYGALPVCLDFSVVNDVEYYHDLVFRGFVQGAPTCVISGGRYDRLLRRMGKQGGAIGFAVYLDQIGRAHV